MPTTRLTKEHFAATLQRYRRAWETQNTEAILEIFTEDATYHERLLEEPMRGHRGIREYWNSKVVEGQANIKMKVVSMFIDGNVGIAEWEVTFDDTKKKIRRFMKEIAVLEFDGPQIKHLREYWTSRSLGEIG